MGVDYTNMSRREFLKETMTGRALLRGLARIVEESKKPLSPKSSDKPYNQDNASLSYNQSDKYSS